MAYTTINKSTDYFNTKLYTGNGSTQSITGVGHQPDLVWVKQRNGTAYHQLTDACRGVNSQAASNDTGLGASNACVTAFNSDGFALGSNGDVNGNTLTYASWNWKANGQGSSNTDGTINSTYTSASTTSGFSIVSYTGNGTSGATVGHGLGVIPQVIIVKRLNATDQTIMYHHKLNATPQDYYIRISDTGAASDFAGMWNDTAPTSSLFSIGNSPTTNANSEAMIAYCFAEKQGFSKFGSYIGNGNADGTFIYTGFKPAWIMTRAIDIGGGTDWYVFDNKRPAYNLTNLELQPNNSGIESSDIQLDILSNGFKPRGSQGGHNGSGKNYIYMAYAEEPLVSTNGTPATAR